MKIVKIYHTQAQSFNGQSFIKGVMNECMCVGVYVEEKLDFLCEIFLVYCVNGFDIMSEKFLDLSMVKCCCDRKTKIKAASSQTAEHACFGPNIVITNIKRPTTKILIYVHGATSLKITC